MAKRTRGTADDMYQSAMGPLAPSDSAARLRVQRLLRRARSHGRGALLEAEAKTVLSGYGVPVPRHVVLRTPQEAPAALAGWAGPFAVKVVALDILHKSDVGGVRLGLEDVHAVEAALQQMRAMPALGSAQGWLVEEMIPAGLELLIGGLRHARLGPLLMFGLGGVFVEYLQDVAIRICPITPRDAHAMLDEIKAAALLDGARGGVRVDRPMLVDLLMRIGGENGLLLHHEDHIAELDINPIIATDDGLWAADARIVLAQEAACRPPFRPVADLRPLLEPATVAVVGASANRVAPGNQFIDNLRQFGFQGRIYPIHPQAAVIQGLRAYPSLEAVPEPVDYAYLAVAAAQCAPLLEHGGGRVAFAQVMSGGFSERAGGSALERQLLETVVRNGIRLVGPNTMGTYSPKGGLSYLGAFEPEAGTVSVLSQSGGLCTDIVRRGARRGLRFRTVVSLGNSADVGAAELLPALLADDDTQVIGLYLEDPHRGRELLQQLLEARGRKPVVLLVGGQTAQGNRAASSHTGALAGDARAWRAISIQTGAPLTNTLDEFIDVLLAMQTLRLTPGQITGEVVLFGNGGGTSVLAADAFGREGLAVRELAPAIRGALEQLSLPAGASVANPIDVPANVLQLEQGAIARRIVSAVFAGAQPDAFVIHINVPVILNYAHVDILGNLMSATLEAASSSGGRGHVLLVLRSDGEPEMEARRTAMTERARKAGIAVYHELVEAAKALAAYAVFEAAAAERLGS